MNVWICCWYFKYASCCVSNIVVVHLRNNSAKHYLCLPNEMCTTTTSLVAFFAWRRWKNVNVDVMRKLLSLFSGKHSSFMSPSIWFRAILLATFCAHFLYRSLFPFFVSRIHSVYDAWCIYLFLIHHLPLSFALSLCVSLSHGVFSSRWQYTRPLTIHNQRNCNM